jgi:hypothetical protein
MEMAVRSMEMAEIAMETNGDGSGGQFPILIGCQNRDFCASKFIGGGGGTAELFLKNYRVP